MAKRYDWGDKLGKVHSIPLATHKQHKQAVQALGGRDLTAPPDAFQAYREANAAANAQFGPQVQAAKQLRTNVAPWFQDFMSRVAGYAQAAQTQSAPVLQQAQTYQQGAAAQAPPGLDPTSAAGQQATQAAAGRQALAQLGMDALNAQNTATQDLFKGQQAVAAREQPQAQTAADLRLADAKSQRGAALTNFLTGARQNAQNYAIARGTLGLNTDKAIADANSTAASTDERARHNRATERNATKNANSKGYGAGRPGMNKYGYTYDEWTALKPADRAKARAGKPKQTKPTDQATQYEKDFYDKYGIKPAGTGAVGKAQTAIQSAKSFVGELAQSNDRPTVGNLLLQGGKVKIGTTKQNGKTVPVYKTYPKQNGLWLTVALDMHYLHGISRGTADKLHHAGYSVKQLGLPSTPRTPKLGTAPLAPGANGQQRPT